MAISLQFSRLILGACPRIENLLQKSWICAIFRFFSSNRVAILLKKAKNRPKSSSPSLRFLFSDKLLGACPRTENLLQKSWICAIFCFFSSNRATILLTKAKNSPKPSFPSLRFLFSDKLLVLFFLASCQSHEDLEALKIEQGRTLFHQVHIGKNNVIGCISCHSLNSNEQTVGPSLLFLHLRAGKLVAGQTAREYIRESITNPDAYIVSGYTPAVMFRHYQSELSAAEIDALVEFLVTLNPK